MTEIEVDRPRRSLTARIVIGMVAGLALGVSLNMLRTHGLDPQGWVGRALQSFLIDGLFYVVGAVFMASLKLLVVPLVFVSWSAVRLPLMISRGSAELVERPWPSIWERLRSRSALRCRRCAGPAWGRTRSSDRP